MLLESRERKEIPSQVLFHGTTVETFNRYSMSDGSYRNPEGGLIWLDESTATPLTLAREYQEMHGSDGVIIIARTDKLSLQKPPNAVKSSPAQLLIPRYWTTHQLPAGSFVSYNITEDLERLYDGTSSQQHMIDMKKICEPLGVIPDYVKMFTK